MPKQNHKHVNNALVAMHRYCIVRAEIVSKTKTSVRIFHMSLLNTFFHFADIFRRRNVVQVALRLPQSVFAGANWK